MGVNFDSASAKRIAQVVRKVERQTVVNQHRRAYFGRGGGGGGGSGGTTLRLFRIEKRVLWQADPPIWLYWGREVDYDADLVVSALSGGFASDGAILTQGTPDALGPIPSTPLAGSVLEPTPANQVVFDWPDVPGASNYRISFGSTLDGTGIVNAATTASSTYTLDATLLPGDGSVVYLKIESFIDPDWTVNRYTYLDPASTRHMARNITELTSVSEDPDDPPGVQCNDIRKRPLPTDSRLMPIGGAPAVEDVPTGEAAETWSIARNQVIVPFWMATRDGVSVAEFREPNIHDIVCGEQTEPEPEDTALARLVSPAPGATLTTTAVTVTISGVSGALEYWLSVGKAPSDAGAFGDGTHFDASLGTGTSQAVTIPDDGKEKAIRVSVLMPTRPYWRHNDYVVTADTP